MDEVKSNRTQFHTQDIICKIYKSRSRVSLLEFSCDTSEGGAEGISRTNVSFEGQSPLHLISSSTKDPTPYHSSLGRNLEAEVSLTLAV